MVVLAALASILLVLFLLGVSQRDPYVRASLDLEGNQDRGEILFRMNCVGCHGISAQGLVGPSLLQVTSHHTDSDLIKQIVSGRTPPMPSFEMEPQAMADLLIYLHSLD